MSGKALQLAKLLMAKNKAKEAKKNSKKKPK